MIFEIENFGSSFSIQINFMTKLTNSKWLMWLLGLSWSTEKDYCDRNTFSFGDYFKSLLISDTELCDPYNRMVQSSRNCASEFDGITV